MVDHNKRIGKSENRKDYKKGSCKTKRQPILNNTHFTFKPAFQLKNN